MNTTDFVQKALDKLAIFDPEMNKHYCGICAKQYKHTGSCENHVKKEHLGQVQRVMEELVDAAELNEMTYYHKKLFTLPAESIARLTEETTETKEKLITSFSYYLDQYAENLIKNEERIHLMVQTQWIIEQHENIKDIYVGLCNFRDSLKDEVIDRFPRHSCTNEISNIVDRLKMHAKADFVRSGFSGGFLEEMIRCADKLSNWDDKEEE